MNCESSYKFTSMSLYINLVAIRLSVGVSLPFNRLVRNISNQFWNLEALTRRPSVIKSNGADSRLTRERSLKKSRD